jgi:hypothetical protein
MRLVYSATLSVQCELHKLNLPANSSTESSSDQSQSAEPLKRLTGHPLFHFFGIADNAPPNDKSAAACSGIGPGAPRRSGSKVRKDWDRSESG